MSPITFTQQGVITQCEFAKILIVTSDGMIEVSVPWTDDDRRDMEIHLRGKFAGSFAFQMKSTMHLDHRYRAYHLSMFFSVPKAKLVSHPNFYYCFAYFDIKTLGFADPLFIVPSTEVHKHASPHLEGDRWTFNFGASLDPNSHDHWHPYQVMTHGLGTHVLDLLNSQKAAPALTPLPPELTQLNDLVFVGRVGA
jgi:hypothetical protein